MNTERREIKFVGFDKDGTLFDSMSFYTKEWGRIIKSDFGVDPKISEDVFIELAGKATAIQLQEVLRRSHISLSEEKTFEKGNEIATLLGQRSNAQLFADVEPALKRLKDRGYGIFVSSGQQEEVVQKDLTRVNLIDFVDFYAGVRPNDPSYKKGEAHFKAAASYFKIPYERFCSEAIFIGDTPEDVEVSKRCGILGLAREGTVDRNLLIEKGAVLVLKDFSNLDQVISNL